MGDCFVPARILLPEAGIPLESWACIAVDQFTSQPEYWEKAEAVAAGKPSTLHIVLPETYLGTPAEARRTADIRTTMEEYRRDVLTRTVNGFVYVERTQQDGTVRQGLVGAVDLEQYSYRPGAQLPIRPSESTVVERIPPRLKVRRGATLETPHVMMLADDPEQRLIEPVAACKDRLPKVYDGELMLGGGHITGWAVEDPALIARIGEAVRALGSAVRFDAQYPAAAGRAPMTLAVGDGNHSLATAKACWEERKSTLTPEQQVRHPARWCLAEVCNVQSPAIEIEQIHRVVFGAAPETLRTGLAEFAAANGMTLHAGEPAGQSVTIVTAGGDTVMGLEGSAEPLTVGTVEKFLESFLRSHPECTVDYIHGEVAVRQMAAGGAVGLLLPGFAKADLFRGVVLGGVLPRKTFSMGHAEEKRYYLECRSLTDE
ncbi:MAG: DUF1015 domain-containing protein [Gemmiger sp.]